MAAIIPTTKIEPNAPINVTSQYISEFISKTISSIKNVVITASILPNKPETVSYTHLTLPTIVGV